MMRDDLISRQAAIEATYDVLASYSYIDEPGSDVAERVENILKEMPSVQQKTYQWGRQILFDDGFGGVKVGYACPACKTCVPNKGNYCSNCGAKFKKR